MGLFAGSVLDPVQGSYGAFPLELVKALAVGLGTGLPVSSYSGRFVVCQVKLSLKDRSGRERRLWYGWETQLMSRMETG